LIYQQDAVYKSIESQLNRSITIQSTRGAAHAVPSKSPQKAERRSIIMLTFKK